MRRQQELLDAQDPRDDKNPPRLQELHEDMEVPAEQQDDDTSSMSSILMHPGETQATTTSATTSASATQPLTGSALHARQANEMTERINRLLDQTAQRRALSASRNQTLTPLGSSVPRLRTTETEYDLSPDRSARLSTPPDSLYTGTPSGRDTNHQETESLQELDSLASPPFASPSARYARSQKWLEQEKILRHNKELFERHRRNLKEELANAAARMSQSQGVVDQEQEQEQEPREDPEHEHEQEQEQQNDLMEVLTGDDRHEQDTPQEAPDHPGTAYEDQGYDMVDEEVSFKRPITFDSDTPLPDGYENGFEPQSSDFPPTPRVPVKQTLHPPTPRVPIKRSLPSTPHVPVKRVQPVSPRALAKQPESQSWTATPQSTIYSPNRENALLEVVKKTAAITEELRGVYSNLQELFSPETEAKWSGAMSVLSAHKSGSGGRASNTRRLLDDEETIPQPVFEPLSSPSPSPSPSRQPPAQLPMTPKTPTITKRKPAALRPAVMPSVHRTPLPEQQQRHPSQAVHNHDVPLRGLVSNAESSRRLHRDNENAPPRKSKSPSKVFHTFSVEAETPRERHQERFRRKLDGWKRIERRSLLDAPPLPTYPNYYVATSSSRQSRTETTYRHVKHSHSQGNGHGYDHNHNQEAEEGWEEEQEEEPHDGEDEEPYELVPPPVKDDRNVYRERILEDLRAQAAREEELRQGRVRRSEGFESDEELLNHKRVSKRRREAAFWS